MPCLHNSKVQAWVPKESGLRSIFAVDVIVQMLVDLADDFPYFGAMIRDHLLPSLMRRFPDRIFAVGTFPVADATLPFPYDEIGPLEIRDDGDEVTVTIGGVTHGHFGCYEEAYTEDEKHRAIVENVMDFLDDLFSDRIVLNRAFGGRIGGWRTLTADEQPRSARFGERFLWSRPL